MQEGARHAQEGRQHARSVGDGGVDADAQLAGIGHGGNHSGRLPRR
jgi:hypothetical protein